MIYSVQCLIDTMTGQQPQSLWEKAQVSQQSPPRQVVFELPSKEVSLGIIAGLTVVVFVALGLLFVTLMPTETVAVTLILMAMESWIRTIPSLVMRPNGKTPITTVKGIMQTLMMTAMGTQISMKWNAVYLILTILIIRIPIGFGW